MTELINYVNYRVGRMPDLPFLQALDKTHDKPAKPKNWWIRRLAESDEVHSVVHVAVHTHTRTLVGYVVTTWATCDTIRIDRLLVGRDYRRIRIGSRLLLRILADKPPDVTRLTHTVPEQDLDSQLFLQSVGFAAILPLRYDVFPETETGIGIKFEWHEVQDAV